MAKLENTWQPDMSSMVHCRRWEPIRWLHVLERLQEEYLSNVVTDLASLEYENGTGLYRSSSNSISQVSGMRIRVTTRFLRLHGLILRW